MSGQSDNYLPLDANYPTGGSWADDTEPDNETVAPPPKKSAWGTVANVDAINIAEENKKAQTDKKKGPKGAPQQQQPRKNDNRRPPEEGSGQGSYQRREYGEQSSGFRNEGTYQRREYQPRDQYRNKDFDPTGKGASASASSSERPPRPAREPQPLPTSPPYTAFVGNLAFVVSEDNLMEFFGELGVKENGIRIIRDEGNKSKGFGYIEFETLDGLEKALSANETEYMGRRMNVDVENKSRKKPASTWGAPREGGSSRPYNNRGTGGETYNNPTGERRKLELAPRSSSKADESGPRQTRGEDPFGGQTVNYSKVEEAMKKREQAEKEREQRRVEDSKREEEGQSTPAPDPEPVPVPVQPKQQQEDNTVDSKSSWRSAPGTKKPQQGRGRGRGEEGRGRGRGRGNFEQKEQDTTKGNNEASPQGEGESQPKREKRTPSNPHKPSERQDKTKTKQQNQQGNSHATTNAFAALSRTKAM